MAPWKSDRVIGEDMAWQLAERYKDETSNQPADGAARGTRHVLNPNGRAPKAADFQETAKTAGTCKPTTCSNILGRVVRRRLGK